MEKRRLGQSNLEVSAIGVGCNNFGGRTDFAATRAIVHRALDASRAEVMRAVEASLKRLRNDWIDLYQVHRPDPKTPVEETMRALDDLVQQGKVRAIGCSNFSAAELDNAQDAAQREKVASFVTVQDEYSLLARDIERGLIPAMAKRHLSLLPYFPLASGLL